MTTKATRQAPPRFTDGNFVSVEVESTWRWPDDVQTKEMECQTDSALYEVEDMDTQAGLHADMYQEFVTEETDGMTILQRLTSKFTEKTPSEWLNAIESGFVSIDNEPITNPGHVLRHEVQEFRFRAQAPWDVVALGFVTFREVRPAPEA